MSKIDGKKIYVLIDEIEQELIRKQNFLGYISGRLNSMDGDMLKATEKFERSKSEYNKNVKDLQEAEKSTKTEMSKLKKRLLSLKAKSPQEIQVKEAKLEAVNKMDHMQEIEKEITEHHERTVTEIKQLVNGDLAKIKDNMVQCPECLAAGVDPNKAWFTKGGAFARHYASHFKEE